MQRALRKKLEAKIKTSIEWRRRGEETLCSFHTTGPMGTPPYFPYVAKAKGAHVVDVDGNDYVDISAAYGPLLFGHAPDFILEATRKAMETGLVHGLGNTFEIELAELIVKHVPSVERVAFANSGTEATMHALKIARALTGKEKVAKFEGGYHGTHETAQISGRTSRAGSPEAPESRPNFAGIPRAVLENTLVLGYGYEASLDRIRAHKDELAAVIVEPIPTCCPIDFSEFLRGLRAVTEECGVLLIFDEVLSGFRVGLSGAQGRYGIRPDLTTFGKILGGGFPVGAIGGSDAAMQALVSSGAAHVDVATKTVITGTFSGNPITCAAGVATLRHLEAHPEIYDKLDRDARRVRSEVEAYADSIEYPLSFVGAASWMVPCFEKKTIRVGRDLDFHGLAGEAKILSQHLLLHDVVYGDVPVIFMSSAHTEEDVTRVIEAMKISLSEMR